MTVDDSGLTTDLVIDESQDQAVEIFNPYSRDKFGREIIERKIVFYFKDNEIQAHGWVKKRYNRNDKEEIQYLAFDNWDVPYGWTRRKEYFYYYAPNSTNLISILRFKSEHKDYAFLSDSFCMYAKNKIDEALEQEEGFKQIEGLSLKDLEKIKALPDLYAKVIPDFAHQKIASRYGYYLKESALLEEQGLGKTKTAIETFLAKKELGKVDRCLVIGPLSVINNKGWGKQIKTFAPDSSYTFIRGTKAEKIQTLDDEDGQYDFYLANYEGLLTIEDEILLWVDDRTMVILDESSKIKNYYALRTKLCLEIGKLAEYKMLLTGTPVTQNAYDIFSQWYFLDCGDSFGQSYEAFLKRYFNAVGFKKVAKWGALEQIADIMKRKAIRFTKEEALPDLPDKTYQIREVEMSPLQRQYYNAILQREMIRLAELEKVDAQNILVTILRLQQITSGYISPKDSNDVKLEPRPIEGTNTKINELEDLLEEIGDKPIVIWTRFKFDVQNIANLCKRMNRSFVEYVGGMTEKMREETESDFQNGKANIFISIPSAGGYGMNLQRASYAIYYSNDYSLQNRLQSEDRIHRIGQKNNCTIIDLVCNNSIDYNVLTVLQSKKQIADVVTGDWKKFLTTDDILGA